MSANVLILLIPVLALATGLAAVIRMPRKAFLPKPGTDLEVRLNALERELEGVRQELADTHERLDFTERMLTRADESRRLAQGG